MSSRKFGGFAEGIASWRRIMTMVPAENRVTVFQNAADDFAGFVTKGLAKQTAVDELTELAIANGLDIGPDELTHIIAHAFEFHEMVPDLEPEPKPKRKNGKHGDPLTIVPPVFDFKAKAFEAIDRRLWLHAKHYVRRYVVMTVAPGGYGKSSLLLCNALEMVTGRGLIGPAPVERCRVLYWNAEESERAEIERRIAALCLAHSIKPDTLTGELFLGDKIGSDEWRFAGTDRQGKLIQNVPLIKLITEFIGDHHIGCAIFDPMVSFHRLPEFDTRCIEGFIKDVIEPMAQKTNSCIEFSHHTRKTSQGFGGEVTSDDSRGAGAAIAAARSVRVLNRMTREEAEMPKISDEQRRRYLRINRDKENMVPPARARWIYLADVDIGNGGPNGEPADHVQAVTSWDYPSAFEEVSVETVHFIRALVTKAQYRIAPQAAEWLGHPLADHLGLDPADKGDRRRIVQIIKTWLDNGVLAQQEARNDRRQKVMVLIPGPWRDLDAEFTQPAML